MPYSSNSGIFSSASAMKLRRHWFWTRRVSSWKRQNFLRPCTCSQNLNSVVEEVSLSSFFFQFLLQFISFFFHMHTSLFRSHCLSSPFCRMCVSVCVLCVSMYVICVFHPCFLSICVYFSFFLQYCRFYNKFKIGVMLAESQKNVNDIQQKIFNDEFVDNLVIKLDEILNSNIGRSSKNKSW